MADLKRITVDGVSYNIAGSGGGGGGGAVDSVNGQTGDVVLDAADVGAIASPSSPASGAFLVWNGTAWVAQTLATWQGGSY